MWVSKPILILGDEPMAKAICRVLGLFGQECHLNHGMIGNTSFGGANARQVMGGVSKAHELRKYPLIIAIASEGLGPLQIIRLVYHLRSDLAWEGGFLWIARTVAEKHQLMELSLLGEQEGRFRFGEVPGHAALCKPLLLADLLQAVSTMEEMSLEAWYGLLDQSSLGGLLEKLDEAEGMLEKRGNEQVVRIVREVLDEMSKTDWLVLLLDPHKDLRLVNSLIETYPLGCPLKVADCPVITAAVRQILSKSCIGGAPCPVDIRFESSS